MQTSAPLSLSRCSMWDVIRRQWGRRASDLSAVTAASTFLPPLHRTSIVPSGVLRTRILRVPSLLWAGVWLGECLTGIRRKTVKVGMYRTQSGQSVHPVYEGLGSRHFVFRTTNLSLNKSVNGDGAQCQSIVELPKYVKMTNPNSAV